MAGLRILAISNAIPVPSRSAGGLRYYEMLRALANAHDVTAHAYLEARYAETFGRDLTASAKAALVAAGVRMTDGTDVALMRLLRNASFDTVLLEHFESGATWLKRIRLLQPAARILVDSIDLAHLRLRAKANVTGRDEDLQRARDVEAREMAVYAAADLVIAVSDAERDVLASRLPTLRTATVTLMFRGAPPIRPVAARADPRFAMLFVGDYTHDANVDAILWFVREVLPRIRAATPAVLLRIVGGDPPPEVTALAGDEVEVLGYVEDLEAVYAVSDVSLAPMRYGAGLKGKIAESLFRGVPVVCHRASLGGFTLVPGEEILVADDAERYAAEILRLVRDDALRQALSARGLAHVRDQFSVETVARQLEAIMTDVPRLPVKRLPASVRWAARLRTLWERHVAWRFRPRRA